MPPRKAPARAYPTLDQWAHRRIVTVDLDEKTKVDYRIPDLDAYIARGTIPSPLRAAAEREEYGPSDPSELTDEQKREHFELQVYLIATHLVKPNLIEELGSEEAAISWVEENITSEDRQKLWLSSLHVFAQKQGLASVMDLLPFLEEQTGPGSADNGRTERASSE